MAEQQKFTHQRVQEEERERRFREEEAHERRRLEFEQQSNEEEERRRIEALECHQRERRVQEELQELKPKKQASFFEYSIEALERHAMERRVQEEMEQLAIKQEEKRIQLAEQQRQEDEAARIEEARREQMRLEQENCAAHLEENAARQQMQEWLKKNGYASVNTKKSKLMKGRYPLHDATLQRDLAAVRLLLRFGADATFKNTSGQTPQELAKKTKGCEAIASVFSAPSQTRRGGA